MSQNSRPPSDFLTSDVADSADGAVGELGRADYLLRSRRRGAGVAGTAQSPRHRALLQRALESSDVKAPAPGASSSVTRWKVPTGALVILALVLGLVALWSLFFTGGGSTASVIPVAGSGASSEAFEEAGAGESSPEPGLGEQASSFSASAEPGAGSVGAVVVHVAGAVHAPGVYELPSGSRVNDAVLAAGGLRPDADTSAVNLAAPTSDGSQVYIPVEGEVGPEQNNLADAGKGFVGSDQNASDRDAGGGADAPGLVNINTASAEELQTLPKVGPVLAASIISWREQYGGFSTVDELDQVSGIGPATLEALRPLVAV